MTKIKICGLCRPCDVEYVNAVLPDYCGLVINFPKSHRNLTPEQARELRAGLSPRVTPVGVFVDRPAEEIAALLNDGTITVAQLHGHEDDAYIAALRKVGVDAVLMGEVLMRAKDKGALLARMREAAG